MMPEIIVENLDHTHIQFHQNTIRDDIVLGLTPQKEIYDIVHILNLQGEMHYSIDLVLNLQEEIRGIDLRQYDIVLVHQV